MTQSLKLVFATAVVLGLGGSAAVLAQHSSHPASTPSVSDTPSTKALKEVQMKMMDSMQVQYTGVPDIDFVRSMIPHHQGAIEMAKVQLTHGKDPEIRAAAQKIIKDQEKEIAEMEAWLKKNAK